MIFRRVIAALTATLAIPLLTTTSAQAASSYPVTATLNVRISPSTSAGTMGQISSGEYVKLLCQDRGTSVNGSTRWDLVEYRVTTTGIAGAVKRGWVSDYYVKTGTSGPVSGVQQGSCPEPVTRLLGGGRMNAGKSLSSPSAYSLYMQSDGNLVWRGTNYILCQSRTNIAGSYVRMQTDGNLVVYTPSGHPVWASNTNNNPGAYLDLQRDANIVIYGPTRAVLFDRWDC
jgi:uncharacterized protein YraI